MRSLAVLVGALVLAAPVAAQTPYLVKEIHPGPFGAGAVDGTLVNLEGLACFLGDDGQHGRQLWRSDGTEPGTFRLTDLGNTPALMTGAGAMLFFRGEDPASGGELWKTDGTLQGTGLVKDIWPGDHFGVWPSEIVPVGSTVYFLGVTPDEGVELWKSDGTPGGTVLVRDVNPGPVSSHPHQLTNVGGTLFFVGYDDVHGQEIWKSDGTAAGTVPVTSFAEDPIPTRLTAVGGLLVFWASTPEAGNEAWRTDGTSEGTYLLRDIYPGPLTSRSVGSEASQPAEVDGVLFFPADDPDHGSELWRTDGTSAGTVLVKDVIPGTTGGGVLEPFIALSGRLLFKGYDEDHSFEPWTSDGTDAGTFMIKDVEPGVGDSLFFPAVRAGRQVYLQATNFVSGREIWRTDGTEAGTNLLHDFIPGATSSNSSPLGLAGSRVFMTADDGVHGFEPWAIDVLPALSVDNARIVEGTGGTRAAQVTVRLSGPLNTPVTVAFSTVDRSAVAGSDYAATVGMLTFDPGVVTRIVSVPILGDAQDEPYEDFFLDVSGASPNVVVEDGRAVIGIVDDDVTLSVSDATRPEGHAGVAALDFVVSLSSASAQEVQVTYAVGAGTATPGVDVGAVTGTVAFPPGTTTRTASVPVLGDHVAEPDETFFLNLSGPLGATVVDGQGLGTILNDDADGLSILDVVVRERPTPATATATFTVSLAPVSAGTVTVSWATADGTATAGSDYAAGSATLTFDPGVSTRPVTVTVNADPLVEGVETFAVNLSGASGASIAHATGTGRILDPPSGGDFNGDNGTDLLWRHGGSGENVLWFMNGPNLVSGVFTTPSALGDVRWNIVGTSDFNADSKPDILWRHSASGENVLWFMNGATLASGTFLDPPVLPDTGWGMAGTGDFDLDGRPDILWRHSTSGEMVVWFMNGSVLASGTFLTPPAFPDVSWQAVGTGDFNGDGKTDILWRHAVSGQNAAWFLEGTSLVSGAFLNPPVLADVRWRMVAVGDYNFDGKPDIVWRHSLSGQNAMWFMDGIDLVSGTFTSPSTLADPAWRIVGPR